MRAARKAVCLANSVCTQHSSSSTVTCHYVTTARLFALCNVTLALVLAAATVARASSDSQVWFPDTSKNSAANDNKKTRQLSSNDNIVFDQNKYDDLEIAQGIQQFAFKLDLAIRAEQGEQHGRHGTVVFSPLSVSSLLALVLLGAAGTTHQEVAAILGLEPNSLRTSIAIHMHLGKLLDQFTQQPEHNGRAAMANTSSPAPLVGKAVFVQQGLQLTRYFSHLSDQIYNSEHFQVDFRQHPDAARDFINRWVAVRTAGKIQDLLAESPATHTQLILASALYFRGSWVHPFPDDGTQMQAFEVSPTESETVPMMVNSDDFLYVKSKELGCAVVGLPYNYSNALDKVTMYLLLPDQHGPDGVLRIIEELASTREALDTLLASAQVRGVIVTLPRLHLDTSVPLVPALRNLGLHTLFDPSLANLSNMVHQRNSEGGGGVYVDEVRHRVTLDVTETGTVAAAATAALISRDGSMRIFRANRPFAFVIRHDVTGMPLFWGSVMRPN